MAISARVACLLMASGLAFAGSESVAIEQIPGFVENRGQWASEIIHASRHGRIDVSVTTEGIALRPRARVERGDDGEEPRVGDAPDGVFLRVGVAAAVQGVDEQPTKLHFLRGREGAGPGSARDVPVFEEVVMREVSAGVDVVVRREEDGFAYDVHVAAGVATESVTVELHGAWSPQIRVDGSLVVETASGPLVQRIGRSWEIGGSDVEARFAQLEATEAGSVRFGFDVPERDTSRGLVIDPELIFATYVGGAGQELPRGMDVGADGATYLTSQGFFDPPTTPGAYDPDWTSNSVDVWVCCLSPDGSTLEWGTLLASNDGDDPFGVNVDADGTVVVFGNAFGADFPTTAGSIQPTFAGKNDLFITRLSADGSSLVWSTFYGGPDNELARLSTLAANGDVIITAEPYIASPPATPGAFDAVFEDGKHLIARLSADGTKLLWQGYLAAFPGGLDIGDDGTVYFGGQWKSLVGIPFLTTPGAFVETPSPDDSSAAAVAAVHPDGSALRWATLVTLPGDNSETVTGIASARSGAVYIVGNVTGAFPVTPGAFDTQSVDGSYVAKILAGGRGLVWATYIDSCCGGTIGEADLALDRAGRVIIAGFSNEPNYPVTPDAFQPNYIGPFPTGDAHFTRFDAFGESLLYSTYYGGFGSDSAKYIDVDDSGAATIGVFTGSIDLMTTTGAFDSSYNEGGDTVMARFDLGIAPWHVLGGGANGTYGKPNLAGAGNLEPGSLTRLSVRGGREGASAFLVVGLDVIDAPVKGGVLVPSPDLIIPLLLDSAGALDLVFPWVPLPLGIEVTTQMWIEDPEGPKDWSATNALTMGAPGN